MSSEVRFWIAVVMLLAFVSIFTGLIARDVRRDRRRRKEGNVNSTVPRGPWYPRFLPFSHLFESAGNALEDNPGYGYKHWLARAATVLAFLVFIALVWGIVWFFF
ncbi:MAG: hypothetical protein ACRD5I_13585 [Candidatus Acidiferrales bacterium]